MKKDLLDALERRGYEKMLGEYEISDLAHYVSRYVEMKKQGEITDFIVIPSKEVREDNGSYTILLKRIVDAKVDVRKLERSTQIPIDMSVIPI